MAALEKLRINTTKRNARKSGPLDSDTLNDTLAELVQDLANIQAQWNDSLVPLLESVASGSVDDGTDLVDAFTDGLDGKTLYVDTGAEATGVDAKFYNAANVRPNTMREQFDHAYAYIDDTTEELRTSLAESQQVISDEVKTRIGDAIFDTSLGSSPTSLDGQVETARANIVQVAKDLYGSSASLDGDGLANLSTDVQSELAYLRSFFDNLDAGDISIADAGGYFTSANVEDALQEIADGFTFYGDLLPAVSSGISLGSAIAPWDLYADEVFIYSEELQHNNLTVARTSNLLVDGAEVLLPPGVAGWGMVQLGDNIEYAYFSFDATPLIVLISNSANVSTVDGAPNLSIYDAGGVVGIKNNTGFDYTLRYDIKYS